MTSLLGQAKFHSIVPQPNNLTCHLILLNIPCIGTFYVDIFIMLQWQESGTSSPHTTVHTCISKKKCPLSITLAGEASPSNGWYAMVSSYWLANLACQIQPIAITICFLCMYHFVQYSFFDENASYLAHVCTYIPEICTSNIGHICPIWWAYLQVGPA